MQTLLGIDLGTSSIKVMLLDVKHGVVAIESKKYDVDIPETNSAEQNPCAWWNSTIELLHCLKKKNEKAFNSIAGVGLSGQMHGLVALDNNGEPLRPAIIWLDQRSSNEVEEINQKLTEQERREILHNRVYPGFMFPSLLWLKHHEYGIYEKIYKIVQPKDYIRFKLTGCIGTEVSDASATAAFDVKKRQWAWEIIERFGVKTEIFPTCRESTEIAGYITRKCALISGLKEGIPVIYGCGDQVAQSIGNGIVREGDIVSNIGTGGQISAYSDNDTYDEKLRTHTFCHAINEAYTIFGATLSCGLSLRWLTSKILGIDDFDICNDMALEVPPGSDGILYLPYLSGERTPIMNVQAKGIIFGLKFEHDRRYIIRAVMEGIIFSLKDSLLLLERMGIKSNQVIASGGGSVSSLFLQMQADIFEKDVKVCDVKEQACLGACLLAGVGIGIFDDINAASRKFVTFSDVIYKPNQDNIKVYRKNYELYHELYEKTKTLMESGG